MSTIAQPAAPSESASHEAYLLCKHLPGLDGLRALAILEVIAHHADVGGITGQGFLGVSIFFAISGFLVTTLLLREQSRTGTIARARFHTRRMLRIWPLYFAVLAVYVVAVTFLEKDAVAKAEFFQNLPYFATFTTNLFVHLEPGARIVFYFSWSLAAQEQFYLLWPTVLRRFRGWWGPALAVLAFLAFQVAVRAVFASEWTSPLMLQALSSFVPIVLGCFAAFALHRRSGFHLLSRIAGRRWSFPVALAVVVAAQYVPQLPRLVTDVSVTFLIVAAVLGAAPLATWVLESRPLRHVGVVSYGIYLMHMLAMNAARMVVGRDAGPLLLAGMTAVLSVAAATVSRSALEQPILSWRDRIARRRRPALDRRPLPPEPQHVEAADPLFALSDHRGVAAGPARHGVRRASAGGQTRMPVLPPEE